MNIWQKTQSGWGIACAASQNAGDVVTVTKRGGATSQETLGERIVGNTFACATVRQKPAAVQVGNMAGVCSLFDNATRSKLRRPAIVLHIVGLGEVRLSMAGASARIPGSINVVAGEVWFGRILRSGSFEPSGRQELPSGLVAALTEFASEPARVAADHGRRTGRCCFCDLTLNDERSTAVGYGQTCAKRWGQPWGAKAARAITCEAVAA